MVIKLDRRVILHPRRRRSGGGFALRGALLSIAVIYRHHSHILILFDLLLLWGSRARVTTLGARGSKRTLGTQRGDIALRLFVSGDGSGGGLHST